MTGSQSGNHAIASLTVTTPADTLRSLRDSVQLSVSAVDAQGDAVASGTVTWKSSDPTRASVSSNGIVTALRNGTVRITASTPAVEGEATITVAQEAAKLAFVRQPSSVLPNTAIDPSVTVAVTDARGYTVGNSSLPVTVTLEAAGSTGALAGTTTATAIEGVAYFDKLSVTQSGHGYRLTADGASVSPATSEPFDILIAFKSISVGYNHSCGLTPDGKAYCWGDNTSGRLGDGTMTSSPAPVAVTGDLTFASVVAGAPHTCALTASGVAYCWGDNGVGELGTGETPANSLVPLAVNGGIAFASIIAGWHSCALTAAGSAYCWGGFSYTLGADPLLNPSIALEPVRALHDLTFTSVAAGLSFTCGVTPVGDAYCAGENELGQLGDGSTAPADTVVTVAGGLHLASVAAGNSFACGLTVDGAAWCWGANESGQLGAQLSDGLSAVPVAVKGAHVFTLLTVGATHACGIATDHVTYCWGEGDNGELGDGTSQSSPVPVAVAGDLQFVSVDAGGFNTCGLTQDGVAYCWGINVNDELGSEHLGNGGAPVLVAGNAP